MDTSNNKNNAQRTTRAIISNDVRDYGNDPFVLKKAKESKEFLEKHGFPEDFIKFKIEQYNKLLKKGF